MKALKRDLQSVVKSLKLLTKKTEQIAKALEKVETPRPTRKMPNAKAGNKAVTRKATPPTATDTVLGVIKRSRKGLDTAALEQKTNFDVIKVRNIIFRLKRQGKIQSKSRGIYVVI